MCRLVIVVGVIAILVLLLVVMVKPAQARSARGWSTSQTCQVLETWQVADGVHPFEDAGGGEDPALVCLALVGGTALLAGLVWMGKMRRC